MDIQRYKVGYYTDEWGMRSNTPCLIKDSQGYAVKFEDYEQLTARVRELEEENARLKAECDDIKQVQFPRKLEAVAVGWKKQLAASQLHAEQLREALNQWINIAANCSIQSGCCCCGDSMENHASPIACGHSPVDMADSVVHSAIQKTDNALALPRDTSALDAYVAYVAYVADKVKEV